MREDSVSGVNGLHAEIIGQLAVRHRVTRAWAYRVCKEVINLESSMTSREVRCGGGREVQMQNVGRGKTVMYGVCKKEVFDIPTTVE